MRPWSTRSRRTILDRGRFLTVEDHQVELPGGRTIDDWPWIITPDYVNVIALTREHLVLCLRQVKYAVSGTSLAPVGGYVEHGEDPLETARRELREETGHTAEHWTPLGSYAVDGNRGAGVAHLFLATGATQSCAPESDDLEEQELLTLSVDELRAAVVNGELKVLSWAAIAALALLQISP